MVKVLHLSDIHLGSGFSHGRTNPETGLNSRFEDFVSSLEHCIDRAIQEPVDLVLFGGDAFPTATPPPFAQDAFARQFRRLVDAQIPTVLLVGNHDQFAQGQGGASLCIYRALGVPDVIVGDRLMTHRISTHCGDVQVITLPWVNHSTLLTRPETEGKSMVEVNELLLSRLRIAIEGEIQQLDAELPTILLAHLMVDTACFGAERFLAVGKGLSVPMTLLCRPCFDYVALGHVHRHQVLCSNPPVVYPGSIERVDFSEETEQKGYVLAHIQKGETKFEFYSLPARPFCTIQVNLSNLENPQYELLKAITAKDIHNAVVRLIYYIRPDQIDDIEIVEVQRELERSHTYTIHPELVSQLAHPRLPELGIGQDLSPLDALKTYIKHHPSLDELSNDLLLTAESLLSDDSHLEGSQFVERVSWEPPDNTRSTMTVREDSSNYINVDSEESVNQLRLI